MRSSVKLVKLYLRELVLALIEEREHAGARFWRDRASGKVLRDHRRRPWVYLTVQVYLKEPRIG
jgi:hypothetical protein